MTTAHRGLRIAHRRRFQGATELGEDLVTVVGLQTGLLTFQPRSRRCARTPRGGLGQVFAHMEKIDQVAGPGAKLHRDLIGDPGCLVAERMHAAVAAQARGDGAPQQLPSGLLDTAEQGAAVGGCGASLRVGQAQLGLPRHSTRLPRRRSGLLRSISTSGTMPPSACTIRVARARARRPGRRRAGRRPQRVRMLLGDLANRARRKRHPVRLLELMSRLGERQIRAEIRDRPLQRQRASAVAHPRDRRERAAPPGTWPVLRFAYLDFPEGAAPTQFFYSRARSQGCVPVPRPASRRGPRPSLLAPRGRAGAPPR